LLLELRHFGLPERCIEAFFVQPAQAAQQQFAPVHSGRHPATGNGLHVLRGGQGDALRGRHHRARQWVFAAALHGCGQGQHG
jgi:hypothetical protein